MTAPAHGERPVAVLAVDGSPAGGGRTRAALDVVASAARGAGATVETISIAADDGEERTLAALDGADAIVFGSPVYRASSAAPLKHLLDRVPRTNGDERDSPLAAKPVAIVYTGASLHHFLALDALRDVLAGFFAAHVLPPGLYVPREGFDEENTLVEPYDRQARLQGAGLVELARLLHAATVLRSLRPQA